METGRFFLSYRTPSLFSQRKETFQIQCKVLSLVIRLVPERISIRLTKINLYWIRFGTSHDLEDHRKRCDPDTAERKGLG